MDKMHKEKRHGEECEFKDNKNYHRKHEFAGGTIGQEKHSELLKA